MNEQNDSTSAINLLTDPANWSVLYLGCCSRVAKGHHWPSAPCRVRRPTSPCPPPLRTNHVGFPSIRSSLLQLAELTHLVQLLMTGFMQMYQILCSICAAIAHCYLVMSLQFLSTKQVCIADRASPVLALSHMAQLSTVPMGSTISGLATCPVCLKLWVIWRCRSSNLNVTFDWNVC